MNKNGEGKKKVGLGPGKNMLSQSDARLILWNTKDSQSSVETESFGQWILRILHNQMVHPATTQGQMTLGERAAEEVFFGRLIGHHSDITDALILADKIVLSSDSWWNRPANRMTLRHLEAAKKKRPKMHLKRQRRP
ncbi:hypothetical protein niasHT_025367 [Heterodera trifolii]|uniref:Uncharacterized protein n=1 Tax=Heterodera trifolii TaxID=157864 RepID=A0ABD2KKN5_9BILA